MIDFNNPLASAVQGMDRASSQVNQVAQTIAGGPVDTVDLSAEAVSLLQAKNDFQSNTKVVQVQEDMDQSLFEITV
jgi:flagellar basal body rod protein FlgG